MQTIYKLDEEDIINILAEKFDTDIKDINIFVMEEITTEGKKENVISAKVFGDDK